MRQRSDFLNKTYLFLHLSSYSLKLSELSLYLIAGFLAIDALCCHYWSLYHVTFFEMLHIQRIVCISIHLT